MKLFATATIAMLVTAQAHASCGAAFCSIETTQHEPSTAENVQPRSSLDLRYEYINQNQPHAGTKDVGVGEIWHHHDEVRSLNQNLVATYIRHFESWDLLASLPFVMRDHSHIHNHNNNTEHVNEEWRFKEIGDAKVSGRYLITPELNVTLGVQLPTGRSNVRNQDGDLAERSLQPGAGTIGGLLGVHYQQIISDQRFWFVQAHFGGALNKHHNYAPGSQLGLDAGVNWSLNSPWSLLGQVNFLVKGRDRGDEAEPEDTGGTFLALSPGIAYAISTSIEVYAFYQQPVYQNVNGVQLVAHQSAVLGLKSLF